MDEQTIDRAAFLRLMVLGGAGLVALSQRATASPPSPSHAKLVSPGEPGEPLVLSGHIFGPDGKPRGGVELYAYHTDANGLYRTDHRVPQWPSLPPRIEGRIITAADGSYLIETIKPAPYPSGGNPAHIHFHLRAAGVPDQNQTIWFSGDPLLTPEFLARHVAGDADDRIRPLTRDAAGVLHCTKDFHLSMHPRGDV